MPRYWARSEGAAMSIQEIQLTGYEVEPRSVTLGTYDSYGLETLQLVPDALWADLSIVATFNAPGGSHKRVKADTDLCVQVPPEAVENEGGVGTVVFVGLQDGQRRISRDLEYTVADHGNADGTEAAPPTPDLVQQILSAANTAEKTANSVREDADAGKFKGEQGQPGPKGDTPDILSNMDIQEILNMLD